MRREDPFPQPLYDKLLQWSEYAKATKTRHPLSIDPYVLVRRNPAAPARARQGSER